MKQQNLLLSEMVACMSFGCAFIFVMLMMFYVDKANTKVGYNFLILLVLNFHNHIPVGLGVVLFTSFLSGFSYVMCRSERLCCLT